MFDYAHDKDVWIKAAKDVDNGTHIFFYYAGKRAKAGGCASAGRTGWGQWWEVYEMKAKSIRVDDDEDAHVVWPASQWVWHEDVLPWG